jgi:hypothetical protein
MFHFFCQLFSKRPIDPKMLDPSFIIDYIIRNHEYYIIDFALTQSQTSSSTTI